MKNYEKYTDEIKNFGVKKSFCDNFIKPYILKSPDCNRMNCIACRMLQMIWLFEEYEEPKEPEVDWSKVAVDTPILVRDTENGEWVRRYFAKFEDGVVHAWVNGNTSWTSEGLVNAWNFAKLAESEKGGAE